MLKIFWIYFYDFFNGSNFFSDRIGILILLNDADIFSKSFNSKLFYEIPNILVLYIKKINYF